MFNQDMNPHVEIVREGQKGSHRASHVWTLRIAGRYVGTYETKRQAEDAAASVTGR